MKGCLILDLKVNNYGEFKEYIENVPGFIETWTNRTPTVAAVSRD